MSNYVYFKWTKVVYLAEFIAEPQARGVKFHIENQASGVYVHII